MKVSSFLSNYFAYCLVVFLKPEEILLWKQILQASGKWIVSPESALLQCLVYAILKNCSYDKALPKHPYLPNVFVLFIDLGHFVIIEKSLGQYRGTVGMFNNIFADKRYNKNSTCYRRKMQSCDFGLTMIFFSLTHLSNFNMIS